VHMAGHAAGPAPDDGGRRGHRRLRGGRVSEGRSAERAAERRAQTNGSVSTSERPSVVRGIGQLLADQVTRAIPRADLDQRDPDYIRETLPGMWLLASFYFRADVRGLENIPADGPVLIVGNHSGGNVTPDTLVFSLAFNTYFGVERRFYQL